MSTTRLITDPEELQSTLLSLKPRRAAVAFVGKAWRQLLGDGHALKELVVSPTAGTHAQAIEEIACEIGWENVYFLERLHAKVYIGPKRVVIGSANLSSNGFALNPSGLYEMVVVSDDQTLRDAAQREYETLVAIARSEYPDTKSKLARVEAMKAARSLLEEAQKRAETRLDGAARPPGLDAYPIGKHRIFLEWWTRTDDEGGEEDDLNYLDVVLRQGTDRVAVGDWVLVWCSTKKGAVHKNPELSWMRVDAVRPQVREDKRYVDQVAQKRKVREELVPFELNWELNAAFQDVMTQFEDMRPVNDEIEPLKTATLTRCEEFLKALKDRYEAPII